MDIASAVLLGIIQGATEWLPVSSSGHLVLAQEYLGIEAPIFFDVLLHVGTLLAVCSFFWRDIIQILTDTGRLLVSVARSPREARRVMRDGGPRYGFLIVLGTLPITMAGYLFESWIESSFHSVAFVGLALLVTGTVMAPTSLIARRKGRSSPRPRDAMAIGLAQIAALFPGISRSGTTISAGLYAGLDRNEAARFSFLLSIPAIFGAMVYHLLKIPGGGTAAFEPYMAIGLAVSAFVGYAMIKPVLMAVRRRKLLVFSVYCWALGGIVLIL